MYFLALSHAAPPLVICRARNSPVTMAPRSIPPSARGPRMKPTASGATTGISPGRIISRWAAAVTIETAVPYSGLAVPSMIPLISRNWRRTSWTTRPPARPTASIASDPNRKGRMPPKKRPTITRGSLRSQVHRPVPGLGEVLGDGHDQDRDHDPDHTGPEQVGRVVHELVRLQVAAADEVLGDEVEEDHRDHDRHQQARVQGSHDPARIEDAHEEGAHDRAHDRGRAQAQREDDPGPVAGEQERARQHARH